MTQQNNEIAEQLKQALLDDHSFIQALSSKVKRTLLSDNDFFIKIKQRLLNDDQFLKSIEAYPLDYNAFKENFIQELNCHLNGKYKEGLILSIAQLVDSDELLDALGY